MAESAYRAHEVLIAPARHRPQLWRLGAGLIVTAAIAIALSRAMHDLVALLAPDLFAVGTEDFDLGNSPASLLLLLGSFGFVIFGVMVAARVVQHRDPLGLIGPLPLALHQFWRVLRLLLVVGGLVLLLPPYDMGMALHRNLQPTLWLMLLPLSLLAVLIQTAAEEILFRGYIQQTLAARFNSPLVWMVAPAVIFALGHYMPAEAGENALLITLWAGLFGLMTADLTARAGTLGPAIAVHLFNNVIALLIVALPDSLSGLALFTVPFSMSDTAGLRDWLVVDLATMAVSWLAARVAIRR